jgi:hypothetical protein
VGIDSTVIFDGTGNRTITSSGDSFHNLTINGGGTWTLQDALDVNGTLSLAAGTLDVSASDWPVHLGRDWVNTGATFTQQSGTVTLDGTLTQNVTAGTQNFANLEIVNAGTVSFLDDWSAANFTDTTPDSTLIFNAGDTYTISGTITLSGQDTGTRITLNSDAPPMRFAFSVSTNQNVSYLSVNNSEVSGTGDIIATFSLDSNTDKAEGQPHWVFVGSGPLRGSIMVVD